MIDTLGKVFSIFGFRVSKMYLAAGTFGPSNFRLSCVTSHFVLNKKDTSHFILTSLLLRKDQLSPSKARQLRLKGIPARGARVPLHSGDKSQLFLHIFSSSLLTLSTTWKTLLKIFIQSIRAFVSKK